MAENSGIAWTDHTMNPWIGCQKVSAACDHCYAESWAERFGQVKWGPGQERRRTSAANWRKPIIWNRQAKAKGIRYKVFCASLADVFDNAVPKEWRDDLWALIDGTPHLDWLLLTKRPQNIAKMLPTGWGAGWPNVWLGTTVENQTEADRRIPHLLRIPAVVRFLSCEPLLGPVDITLSGPIGMIHWTICGGESGAGYRAPDLDWYRGLRDQCVAAGVPFFFKQHAGPSQHAIKKMGRELDGKIWNQYPGIGEQ